MKNRKFFYVLGRSLRIQNRHRQTSEKNSSSNPADNRRSENPADNRRSENPSDKEVLPSPFRTSAEAQVLRTRSFA